MRDRLFNPLATLVLPTMSTETVATVAYPTTSSVPVKVAKGSRLTAEVVTSAGVDKSFAGGEVTIDSADNIVVAEPTAGFAAGDRINIIALPPEGPVVTPTMS